MIRRPPRATRTDTLFPYTTLFRSRQVHAIGVPRCLVAIESELCSNLQQSDAVDEDPYPQLRPLKISQNGCGAAKFLFQGADRCNPRRMIGIVAMAHIDAESIGSGKIKFADHLRAIAGRTQRRSEEHTSELQSLMRISYAVFCLKKKHIKTKKNRIITITQ